jgi:KUP system potassium uptake protein
MAASQPTATGTASRATAFGLALGALGVVYGDIGTSPLYALRECLAGPHSVAPSRENVLGVLSLVFWSLTLVVVGKYLSLLLTADNRGEGGVLALLALVVPTRNIVPGQRRRAPIVLLALLGAALLFGDGMITPAISVLSAVEGLEVVAPALHYVVVPATVAILIGLFLVQRRGTGRVGAMFGPVMLVWFATLAVLGASWIVAHPVVLQALNPLHALAYFARDGWHSFQVLGSVVLVITGGEAVYADMGHFGRRPIRVAWYALVYPALLLNYFGQGALLLVQPGQVANPFFALAPAHLRYPLVFLATFATVIASQAMITGVYSLARQAMQLGYLPRLRVVHTSKATEGQIYIPEVNFLLGICCIALVLAFRDSSALAGAYGIAVTGTMATTSILFYPVARRRFGTRAAVALLVAMLIVDLSFFGANLLKLLDGAWVALLAAVVVFTIMTTWARGQQLLAGLVRTASPPLEEFLADVARHGPVRVPGTGVFLSSDPEGTPGSLLHHFKHNKVLHAQVVLLTVLSERVPEVPGGERVGIEPLPHGFVRLVARYGFMQTPRITDILERCREQGLFLATNDMSFYLGRVAMQTNGPSKMARWRKKLFAFLTRNARTATEFFELPLNRVVEMGMQLDL